MKLSIINDIEYTTRDFFCDIIKLTDAPEWNDFIKKAKAELGEDAVYKRDDDIYTIDFRNMTFTVVKDSDGKAQLLYDASYYPDGFLDDDPSESIIDIELNK
jgi:hypothetical protein